jgi:ketosteroid isomerase-like protein
LIHDSSANAAQSPEKAIRKTVHYYLDAVNAGDIDSMVKYTDDLRFPDKTVQKTNYKGIKESVTDVSIQSLEPLSPTSFKVNVTAIIKGNKQQFALPLVNKYGMWLVVIGQQQQQ